MEAKLNGGPAFPLQSIGPDFAPGYAGMTLRDYFAAKAMQAWVGATVQRCADGLGMEGPETIAGFSYCMADAMLAARASGEQPPPSPRGRAADDDLRASAGLVGGAQ